MKVDAFNLNEQQTSEARSQAATHAESHQAPGQAGQVGQEGCMKGEAQTASPEPQESVEQFADKSVAIDDVTANSAADLDDVAGVNDAEECTADKNEPACEAASNDELSAAQERAQSYQDRFMRLQAEWDNFRKRSAQEAENQRARATEYLIEALIPVIDDLERALEHAQTTDPQGEYKAFVEGVAAVHTKFVEGLKTKTKLEVIDPLGEAFDAFKHQAVGQKEDPSQYEDTIAAVYQKGYELGGYVIRPAMVVITTGGKQRPAQQ